MLNNRAGDDEFVGIRFLDQVGQGGLDDVGVPFADKGVLIAVCELKRVVTCLDYLSILAQWRPSLGTWTIPR